MDGAGLAVGQMEASGQRTDGRTVRNADALRDAKEYIMRRAEARRGGAK